MADRRDLWYDASGSLRPSEGITMTSRPSAPDPPPTPAFESEVTGVPSSSPSEASGSQAIERLQADVGPRAGQSWRQISDEEWRARHEEYKKRLAEIDAQDDMPEEVYDEVMRSIDALHLPKDHANRSPFDEWPYRDVDPRTGRLRPISPEELQARYEALRRELAEIDAQDNTPDEVYDEVLRGIDEERRRQGRPPAFEGHY
jgi:ribosomal protein L29